MARRMTLTTYGTTEPDRITAGDSFGWKLDLDDYPASTWVLSYALVKDGTKIAITGSADGDTHVIEISASTSGAYSPGLYSFAGYVTKSAERYQVRSGRIEILKNFATATSGYDDRSHAKTVLDALEATIEGKASVDQLEVQISGRALKRLSPQDLIFWRGYYLAEYRRELKEEKIAAGKSSGNSVRVRFV